MDKDNKRITSLLIRPGQAPIGEEVPDPSTPEDRINAVWQLTLASLGWKGAGEPRLQRAVSRVQRPPR